PSRPSICTASQTELRAKYRYRSPGCSKGKTSGTVAAIRGNNMCGQVVCMQGTVRVGAGAFSPLPSASRSAAFTMSSPPEQAAQDGPGDESQVVDQLSLPRGPEDGQPVVRPQLALPVELPLHAGPQEVELGQSPGTGIADRLRDHLLARRVVVQRFVVAYLDQVVPLSLHDAQVRGDGLWGEGEHPQGQRAPLRGVARDLGIEPDQLGPLRDGGAVLALPPAGLDLEQVGEGDVEGLRILAVDHGVLHLALLGEPSLPPAQVLAELAVERLLHRL